MLSTSQPRKKDGGGGGSSSSSPSRDPYTNLRIVDRRTSRASMVESFASRTYRSASRLAAASRAEWSAYLADGAGSGSGGGGGKTNLATCGVLTAEASSRISSKTGRAFASFSIGDLPSSSSSSSSFGNAFDNSVRASVTVFLFGDALSVLRDNKKYVSAGWVVGVLSPNLMPSRADDGSRNDGGGGGTSVTLSVNDPRQVLLIGRAADVDRCRGTVRSRSQRSENGRSYWVDGRCGALVDLRAGNGSCGGYCIAHRRQGLSASGAGATSRGGKKGVSDAPTTFVQKHRMEVRMKAAARSKPLLDRASSLSSSSSIWGTAGLGGTRVAPASLSEALSQSGLFEATAPTTSNNASSAPSAAGTATQQQLLKRAPKHMRKMPTAASTAKAALEGGGGRFARASNPYLKDRNGEIGRDKGENSKSPTKRKSDRRDILEDILGDALERKKPRLSGSGASLQTLNGRAKTPLLSSSATSKKTCTRVFQPEGYEGSVQVPKPSAVLFRNKAAAMVTPAPTAMQHTRGLSADAARAILERQRSVADNLMRRGGGAPPPAGKKKAAVQNKVDVARSKRRILSKGGKVARKTTTSDSNSPEERSGRLAKGGGGDCFASAFGGAAAASGGLDRDAIFHARSRFGSEADAREYARARSVVQELEAKEGGGGSKGSSSDGKAKSRPPPSIVTAGWICRTCKKVTPYKPAGCLHARHDVRQKREIREGSKKIGTTKERLSRHGKDAEEGGLTLGSGVEWSFFRGDMG